MNKHYFISILLVLSMLALAGCQLVFKPTQSTPTSDASLDSTTQATGTTESLPKPTTSEAAETDPVTTTAEPSPAQTSSEPSSVPNPDWQTLSNDSQSWYYMAASPTGDGLPAQIPPSVSDLIERYDILWQAPASGSRTICLTMDEGYEYGQNTSAILDVAASKHIPITFFVTGSYIDKNPELVLRMVEEGHLVVNHSDSHPDFVSLLAEQGEAGVLNELQLNEDKFSDLTGQAMPRYFRPPSGLYSERLLALLENHGYTAVFWSFAYRDWLTDDQPDPDQAIAKVIGQLHDGQILLLHAVSATNVQILPELIDEIEISGYSFAKISDIG